MTNALFDKKNVIVAGGAGFIGSHLCEELVRTSRVICVDNLITGDIENINHLLKIPDFKFLRHDISDPLDLDHYSELEVFRVKFQGIQEIYNLASPASPNDYSKYPLETLISNAYGTKNLLYLVLKFKAKMVQVSSSAVYGQPYYEDPYFREDYWGYVDQLSPRGIYAEAKRYAESLIAAFYRSYKLDMKIARIFNVYGPRMRYTDHRLVPDLIRQGLEGRPIRVETGAENIISLCYVSDIADGLIKIMNHHFTGPVNLGNPDKVLVREAAELIRKLTNSSSDILYNEGEAIRQGLPDITLVREKIGWFPLIKMEDGLKRTVDYMKAMKGVLRM